MKINENEMTKLCEAVYHICKIANSKDLKLFSIPLSKIIFLADRQEYTRNLRPMIADAYVHGKNGPYLESLRTAITILKTDGYITTKTTSYGKKRQTEYNLGARTYPITNLTRENLNSLQDMVFDVLVNETAESISAHTHNHAWQVTRDKEKIPMCSQLFSQPAQITDEDRTWATNVCAMAKL